MSWLDQTRKVAAFAARCTRLATRRAALLWRRTPLTLVYHNDYGASGDYLVDRLRAQKILDHLLRKRLVSAADIHKPGGVAIEDLALAHDAEYLASLDDRDVLGRIFGEHAERVDAAAILRQQRRMVAGTMMATRLALEPEREGRPVVSLGGGMHHARSNMGGGFCLFNDVAIAIREQRRQGFDSKVLVIDLDLHHGDGTREIFAHDETVFTFSMHAVSWHDDPAVADLSVELGHGVGDRTYLTALNEHLPTAVAESQPALVFYVAGVDIAVGDRLGNWRVSPDAVAERDRTVVQAVGEVPLVWVLAGGYGEDVWRHTARSLVWLRTGRDRPLETEMERSLRHFRRIAARFTPGELTSDPDRDELDMDLSDVVFELSAGAAHRNKLLNYYSVYGVEVALERYGVLPHIRKRGYGAMRVEFDLDQPTGETVRLFSDDGRRDLLVELVVKERLDVSPLRLLSIEWLLCQDPRRNPDPRRPLLPGQQHPGLGCLSLIMGMLVMTSERLDFDGISFAPAHFHTASIARGTLAFLDPEIEARFLALESVLADRPLAEATALVHTRQVVDQTTGEPVSWDAATMVIPVSEALTQRIRGAEYEASVRRASANHDYTLRPTTGNARSAQP